MTDPDVVHVLRAAVGNLMGAAEVRDWIPRRPSPSLADAHRSVLDTSAATVNKGRKRALVGRMVGGWCEATPLLLADRLRQRRGLAPIGLRVGSLAIPIGHFRNSFNNDLQPEKCHEDALWNTCQILGEAVRLCHRWSFDPAGTHPGIPAEADRVVDSLLGWHQRFEGLSAVTRRQFTSST